MKLPVRLGMLTPSSNTTIEPVTASMLAGVTDVTAHFGRFKVTEIALPTARWGSSTTIHPARRRASGHAKVDASPGTAPPPPGSASTRRAPRPPIEAATGIRVHLRADSGHPPSARPTRIGLVTPYTDDVQAAIFATEGVATSLVAESHSRIRDNFSFAEVRRASSSAWCARWPRRDETR